ncbi:uncharacterized protein [Haliotis cracherodii]|uniref:uncharacterized protein n=1 Tax=Haliotis cracherodii TaxID=6455 RepID=UPI0039ED2E29
MGSVWHALYVLACVHAAMPLDRDVKMPGDFILGGLFRVQSVQSECHAMSTESMQLYEAVRWFFRRLNDRDYIPGKTLGFHAFNTNGQPTQAVNQTLHMLRVYNNASTDTLYGLLGPETSGETKLVSSLLSSLPEEDRLLQISYSATAANLADTSIYKNLYRVIETDDVQVEVIVQVMLSLQWNYIAIVYEMDVYGETGAKALKALAEEHKICVRVFFGIEADAGTEDIRKRVTEIGEMLEPAQGSSVIGMVFMGQRDAASDLLDFLKIKLPKFQIIFTESLMLNIEHLKNDNSLYSRAKGLLTTSPPYQDAEMFRQYWSKLHCNHTLGTQQKENNNWLENYLQCNTLYNSSGLCDVNNYDLPLSVHYILLASAAIAKTMKMMHEEGCPDACLGGLRGRVQSKISILNVDSSADFPEELRPYNESFHFENRKIQHRNDGNISSYSVYNLQTCNNTHGFCFRQVGTFVNRTLDLKKSSIKYFINNTEISGFVEAQCKVGATCSSCVVNNRVGHILHLPGDFYLVGLVPVHNRGRTPLMCGELRTSLSVDIVESIVYAVKAMNEKKGLFRSMLGSKTLGLVMMDTCGTPYLAIERLIKLNSGMVQLDPSTNSSQIASKIIGYVGPYRSSVSVPVSTVMKEIDDLYISYSSTSTTLSNRQRFPNFMRTCSPDHKQASAIMELASKLDSKYVQIIYTEEEYGIAGKNALLVAGKKHKVCVAQSLGVKDSVDQKDLLGYVSSLRKYPQAKVIIIFVLSHVTPVLMSVLAKEIKSGEFAFIGGENWSKREAVLQNNQKLTGSLTVAQLLPKNDQFEQYYMNINVEQSNNPWLREYLEAKAKCHYPLSFHKQYTRKCTPEIIAGNLQTDLWVPFAINAAFSLVLGFNMSVVSSCGDFVLCEYYKTGDLKANVKNIMLDIYNASENVRVFDDNGEGHVGYTIFQVVKDGDQLSYKKVGLSSPEGIYLDIPASELAKGGAFVSQCEKEVECNICNKQDVIEFTSDWQISIPLISTVSGLGACVFILTCCLVKTCRQERVPIEDPYLSINPDLMEIPGSSYQDLSPTQSSSDYITAKHVDETEMKPFDDGAMDTMERLENMERLQHM